MQQGKQGRAAKPLPVAASAGGGFAAVPQSQNVVQAALGNFFYFLGFSAEVNALRVARVVRDIALLAGQALMLLLRWLGQWLLGLLLGMLDDLSAPFRKFRRRQTQLARAQKIHRAKEGKHARQRGFARARMGSTLGFAAYVAGLFTPLLAALILGVTVYSMLTMQYALAVEVNGQRLGYVTDQTVVENAKALLRDRIQLAGNQRIEDWQLTPSYSIARASDITTVSQLTNEILLSGSTGGDIVPATGLYMNNRLIAVTDDGEKLNQYLDEVLEQAQAAAPPDADVRFMGDVSCEPDSDEVFFASSVRPVEDVVDLLTSKTSEDVYAMGNGTAALQQIAVLYGMDASLLAARNPHIGQVDGSFVPAQGEKLLVRRARSFLAVQVVHHNTFNETIPYQVIEQENPERPQGVRQVVQQGADGVQQVWEDEFWIGGEYDRTERLEDKTVIVQAAVDQIVEIGTRSPQDFLGDLSGGGYIFPVPGTTGSSRGIGPGHRGLDINAPGGVPIYACENGVVVTAGWHYSWGNHVVIDHGGGVQTLYAHCSALYVAAGQEVAKGTAIGAVGSTGNSSGNHLHLEVLINGVPTDPVAYVGYPY